MFNFKRIITTVTSFILIAGVLFSTSIFAEETDEVTQPIAPTNIEPSGDFAQLLKPTADDNAKAVSVFTIDKADKLVCENDTLELYLDEAKFIMKIKSKETDYIWSTAARVDKMAGMSTEWQRFCQSMLVMDFITPNGVVKRSALKHANAKKPKITKADDGFTATLNFVEAKATLEMTVTLNENGIEVSIPDDKIELKDGNVVNRLLIMPFLGAGYQDETPGYLFVPDGSGALMKFREPHMYSSIYQQKIYGADSAVSKMAPVSNTTKIAPVGKIYLPVFGAVHGNLQNAFAGIITSGDAYCEIIASPAGAIVDYSWVSPAFVYNEVYWQPTGKAGGFNAIQSTQNIVNAKAEYRFLSDDQASYTGIANEYKSMLVENNPTFSKNNPVKNVPIKLDALMAEPKKSLFGNSTQVMTTTSNVTKWVDELSADGIDNLIMSLVGFEKKGLNGHKIGDFSIDGKIGNKNQLQSLSDQLEQKNGQLFLQSELQSGYEHQFSKASLRYGMDGSVIKSFENKPLFTDRLYANDSSISKGAANLIKNSNIKNFALPSVGSELYADYRRNAVTTRLEGLTSTQNTLKQISDSGANLMLQSPNIYALTATNVDGAYDIPTSNSQFEFFSDSVPFLQTVLSGYIDCYSEYQNFTTNTVSDVLTLIDYNTYPSYILTDEYSNKLVNTNMNGLYSSRYADWKPYIVNNYNMLNDVLSKVSGASILQRSIVQNGVSVTEYSNGINVIVNYNNEAVNYNGVSIEPLSATTNSVKGE